jgi:hypothetical protein
VCLRSPHSATAWQPHARCAHGAMPPTQEAGHRMERSWENPQPLDGLFADDAGATCLVAVMSALRVKCSSPLHIAFVLHVGSSQARRAISNPSKCTGTWSRLAPRSENRVHCIRWISPMAPKRNLLICVGVSDRRRIRSRAIERARYAYKTWNDVCWLFVYSDEKHPISPALEQSR